MSLLIVGGIIEKDGKFLLVQEANQHFFGKWNIPAGHLDCNETIFEGAKREIFEECGCNVELSGILRLGNTLIPDNNVVTIIFSTKLIEENIKFNSDEILDVKWFSYEEIVKMEDELRYYDWIIDAITSYRNNEVVDLSLVRIF